MKKAIFNNSLEVIYPDDFYEMNEEEIKLEIPNEETKEALSEIDEMKKNKKKYKRYSSFDDVLKGID